jgi:hypothetical protein
MRLSTNDSATVFFVYLVLILLPMVLLFETITISMSLPGFLWLG